MYGYLKPEDDGLPLRAAGPWAQEKLDYLARYIAVFESSMHAKWRVRNYVDLLAGPGKNRIRDTGAVILGSPLLALTTRYPFTGYHFVELDPGHAEALRDEPLMRNAARKAPLYRLLFASKHPLGTRFWQEVTKRDVYGQRRLFER